MVHLRQLEGVSFINRRYTKGVPFLSKMACKRIRGGGGAERLADLASYNTLLSSPPLSGYFFFLSGKLFVFLLLVVVRFLSLFLLCLLHLYLFH